jgi:hypothetical protein
VERYESKNKHCKNFRWVKISRVILKKGAEIKGTNYRLANPNEESKRIDGCIGDIPVSVKHNGIEVDYGEVM